jgi:hypothetical protein
MFLKNNKHKHFFLGTNGFYIFYTLSIVIKKANVPRAISASIRYQFPRQENPLPIKLIALYTLNIYPCNILIY